VRAVLDTNVLVSAALLPTSVPAHALLAVYRSGQLLASDATLTELHEVLSRSRFERRASFERRMEFVAEVMLLGDDVEIVTRVTACRDPDDDKFLEVAVNGHATHLVTGDRDLLALHPFRGIPILTPADFLASVSPPTP
jgi:putative PIN family toxin of toxin-antitoxin system